MSSHNGIYLKLTQCGMYLNYILITLEGKKKLTSIHLKEFILFYVNYDQTKIGFIKSPFLPSIHHLLSSWLFASHTLSKSHPISGS